MYNDLLFLKKKLTDTLIEQTKTKPQETLEFKMNKQMETFSFNPPITLFDEGKWLLSVASFEAMNFVFNITEENNSFSISIPGRRRFPNFLEDNIIDKLEISLKFISQNDIELQVLEDKKRGKKNKNEI